jgi:hypothetical protein
MPTPVSQGSTPRAGLRGIRWVHSFYRHAAFFRSTASVVHDLCVLPLRQSAEADSPLRGVSVGTPLVVGHA